MQNCVPIDLVAVEIFCKMTDKEIKSQGIIEVIRIHHLSTMDICTKCHSNRSNNGLDISLKMLHGMTEKVENLKSGLHDLTLVWCVYL